MRKFIYNVEIKYDNYVLQDYLKTVHGYSSRIIKKIKQDKQSIFLNGKHIRMIDRVKVNDILEIILNDQPHLTTNNTVNVPILFEDSDIIIYDKPHNMPVHPTKSHQTDTLGNIFAAHCENLIFRPINRLDSDTTGICVVAKNQLLAYLLSCNIYKEYYAVLTGELNLKWGRISLPIERCNNILIKRQVGISGKRAITEFDILFRNRGYSCAKIVLHTGRTHQIRVHFSHLGYPLAGDKLYNGNCKFINRQSLHCYKVKFIHPITNELICLNSPNPKDMSNIIKHIML